MFTKNLPIMAIALTFFIACSDEECSSIVKPSQEPTAEDGESKLYSVQRNLDFTCDPDVKKTVVDSVSYKSSYDLSKETGFVELSIFYDSNAETEKAVEVCEKFAKNYDFKDYSCQEGVKNGSFHSVVKKTIYENNGNFGEYVRFLCNGSEDL